LHPLEWQLASLHDQFEDDHVRSTTDHVSFGALGESALWAKNRKFTGRIVTP
jgi:hypothetical protein